MIEAVIFDMDGLLIDSEPVWDKARFDMAAQYGKSWNADDHHAVMGVSTQTWVEYMIGRLELTLSPQQVEQYIVDAMNALYAAEIPYKTGAINAVNLAHKNFKTGLASGSVRSLIDTVTSSNEFSGKFEIILAADEVAKGKPAPDVYLETAKRLGVNPESCVCLEDSNSGLLSGINAGMKVVAVPDPRFPPKTEILEQATVVLDSLDEFTIDLINGLGT